jgi:hypothetical protein
MPIERSIAEDGWDEHQGGAASPGHKSAAYCVVLFF